MQNDKQKYHNAYLKTAALKIQWAAFSREEN